MKANSLSRGGHEPSCCTLQMEEGRRIELPGSPCVGFQDRLHDHVSYPLWRRVGESNSDVLPPACFRDRLLTTSRTRLNGARRGSRTLTPRYRILSPARLPSSAIRASGEGSGIRTHKQGGLSPLGIPIPCMPPEEWCPRRESNPHAVRQRGLSPPSLPVSSTWTSGAVGGSRTRPPLLGPAPQAGVSAKSTTTA